MADDDEAVYELPPLTQEDLDHPRRADGRDGTEVLMRFRHDHDCSLAGVDVVFIATVRFGWYQRQQPICAETHTELMLVERERQQEPEMAELGEPWSDL